MKGRDFYLLINNFSYGHRLGKASWDLQTKTDFFPLFCRIPT